MQTRVEHFFSQAFKYFYIIIWSCMKLEDVLEVLPMLILETFLERFVFIRGHKQCSKRFGQNCPKSYYYLKDLKRVYYNYCGLLHGKENQTLLIDDEPNKALQNPKWNGLFLKSFRGHMLSKNKVQWLDLTSCLWPLLLELPLVETVHVHYDYMVKYFKPCLSSSLKNYYWFIQYIYNDYGDVRNNQPPHYYKSYHLQLVTMQLACNWLLFPTILVMFGIV